MWSFGDNLGYGHHGDYLFGWKGDSLKNAFAIDECGNQICGLLTQSIQEANKCSLSPKAATEAEVDGWLDALPGMDKR